MDEQRQYQVLQAFRKRRWSKSLKQESRTRGDLIGECVVVAVGVVLTWLFSNDVKVWSDLILPGLGGLGALLVWEFIVRPCWHYIKTIPEQEHVAAWIEIDEQKAKVKSANESQKHWYDEACKADAERIHADFEAAGFKTERDRAIQAQKNAEGQLEQLRKQASAFTVSVTSGHHWVARDPTDDKADMYLVVNEGYLTNASDVDVAVEVSLRIDVTDSWAISNVAKTLPLPAFAVNKSIEAATRQPRVMNLARRSSSPVGYWAFPLHVEFADGILGGAGAELASRVLERPIWLELENTITQEVKLFPVNMAASIARVRRAGPHTLPTA
jgi:hypothetical protein